ncbi:MAG: OmpA family protein [Flavobacteriales bacterium]|nr:OmpA family protein [Flavobacteriales bacterium]MCX7769217.1 OmpA family protein [Flavobacteriales bacterium]MDW8410430.1 OmpA family protein [Flavobacteriales bacterium]
MKIHKRINELTQLNYFKNIVLFLVLLYMGICHQFIKAQNLVADPSFEKFERCITPEISAKYLTYSNGVEAARLKHWFNVSYLTAFEYFNSCSEDTSYGVPYNKYGFQNARTGSGYAGFLYRSDKYPERRHYLVGQLTAPLRSLNRYRVRFYLSLADKSSLAGSLPAVAFVNTLPTMPSDFSGALSQLRVIEVNDSTRLLSEKGRWMVVTGDFLASGGEKYIIIGHFRNDLKGPVFWIGDKSGEPDHNFCYYYIDDVSVEPYGAPESIPSTAMDAEEIKPPKEVLYFQRGNFFLRGRVEDFITGAPLQCNMALQERVEGTMAIRFQSLPNGRFSVSRKNLDYFLFCSRPGYIPRAAFVSALDYDEQLTIKLVPFAKGAKSPLMHFYYVENGQNIFVEYSKEELGYLAEFLKDNPGFKIRINAHGKRPGSSGESLSESTYRAKQIRDFIVSLGVPETRVDFKGFGDAVYQGAYLNEIEVLSFTQAAAQPPPPPKLKITGVFVNSSSNEIMMPVYQFINMRTRVSKTYSTNSGRFEHEVTPGDYVIKVEMPGYLTCTMPIKVENEDVDLNIELIPLTEDRKFDLRSIAFKPNSTKVEPESFPILNQLAALLKENPSYRLEVIGHTDGSNERTTDAYLRELSLKRAEAVKEYLVSKDIDPGRIITKGMGRDMPIADNNTPEGRAKNRRIEFRIL